MKKSLVVFALTWIGIFDLYAQKPVPADYRRTIAIDLANVKGPLNQSFNFCIGAGRANEGLRADWQRQLKLVKQACGFRYIRFHGLLTDDMGVYNEDRNGNPVYNWQYVDELYDFLLSINVRPFVELGFMPRALASGNKTVFWWKGNITPPKDYAKWDSLIKALVSHWTERYGEAEVKQWYFEVWNEPNLKDLFFSGSMDDYFKLYHETAITIKAISANYRVGGPATAGNAWITEMISFCKQTNTPIDFISTHTYGVKKGFLDLTGNVGTIVSQSPTAIYQDMMTSKKQIERSAFPKLQLHYTEWSASYTPTDPIHDSYHEAAYILNKIKHASPYVNSMSYWTFTDIFEEQGPRFTPFHGGFGFINYQDIQKPAFYAFKFLNQLGPIELNNSDTSSIASTGKNGSVRLLFWNFAITHPGDTVNDQTYYKRDLPAKSDGLVHIMVKNIKPGDYTLLLYQTGYRANDAYSTYLDLKSPSQLTRQQVALIKQKNSGQPSIRQSVHISTKGYFAKTINIRQNDVFLLVLEPKKARGQYN